VSSVGVARPDVILRAAPKMLSVDLIDPHLRA
jgi:hypothetical protein